jgi:protein O-mannosyl-transferase
MALYVSLKFPYTMSLARLGVARRAVIACYGATFYLWKTLIPVALSPLYELRSEHVNPLSRPFFSSIILIVFWSSVLVKVRGEFPALLACWVGYLAALLPVSGIFQTGPQLVADRYAYLATLGWELVLGASVTRVWCRTHRTSRGVVARGLVAFSVVAVTACLVVLTSGQIRIWRSSEALWRHAVTISPSAVAHSQLGVTLGEQGRVKEAIAHFRAALQLNPTYAIARNNLGSALAIEGRLDEAIEQFEEALKGDPSFMEAQVNLERARRLKN